MRIFWWHRNSAVLRRFLKNKSITDTLVYFTALYFWQLLINTVRKQNPRWQLTKTYSQNGTSVCSQLKKKKSQHSSFQAQSFLISSVWKQGGYHFVCLRCYKKCSPVLPGSLCCLYLAPKHYLLLLCSLHCVIKRSSQPCWLSTLLWTVLPCAEVFHFVVLFSPACLPSEMAITIRF